MATEFVETVQHVVYPGDCDVMCHLNTHHYTALFDHTMWELMRVMEVGGSAWKWGESGPCRDRTYDQLIKSRRCRLIFISAKTST